MAYKHALARRRPSPTPWLAVGDANRENLMNGLLIIDVLAAVFVLIGFQLAFGRRAGARLAKVRTSDARQPGAPGGPDGETSPEDVASVLRMVGVMIMAFSITGCAFANMIARYAVGPAS
jgi:hypothetical protein